MEIANYLFLPSAGKGKTYRLKYLRVIGSAANIGVSKEERFESDVKKTRKEICLGYSLNIEKVDQFTISWATPAGEKMIW